MKNCRLCGLDKPLRKSHIIPKFVSRFLKTTSLTGYLRGSSDINKRVQDGLKVELLCDSCESKFSKWEGEFANGIFSSHINLMEQGLDVIKIDYDSSLIKFVISIFWRVLVATEVAKDISASNMMYVNNLVPIWTEFLNEKRLNWGDCEFHLITLDKIDERYIHDFPKYLNAYLFRLWDICAYDANGNVGIFIKLPGLLLLCAIIPSKLPGLFESKIEYIGTMNLNKQIDKTKLVGTILVYRSLAFEREAAKLTAKEYKKIGDEISIKLLKLSTFSN